MGLAFGCLLKRALSVVPPSKFKYRKVVSHHTNDIGNTIAEYTEWIETEGSVQPGLTFSFNARGISNPVQIELGKKVGIDMSKNLITVFVKKIDLNNVNDQDAPDQILYDGRIFNIMAISNWNVYDGWKSLTCVEDVRERHEEDDNGNG